MKQIYENIVNYEYVNSFDIKKLKELLVLPISNDGIYSKFFVCDDSQLKELNVNTIIEEIKIPKKALLFFLSDVENRVSLYKKEKLLTIQKQVDPSVMEEFFSTILDKAILVNASDIHLETLEDSMVVRMRIDGELKTFYVFTKKLFKSISSYIKMLAKLDVTKVRLPQNGRFTFENIDFRVSTMPTINGESLVIRVLDNLGINIDLQSLEFSSHILKSFKELLTLKEGLVLITGPTGSGKTTTLYSLVKQLNDESKKIITIEDPVEYKIEQVQQINVNEDINLSFDTVLKNILRQDPDIILIGEIRDSFSLSIALQASLTGHLVLASIHANSSIDTLSRLIDLSADKFLIASTLKYVISQRLVLKLCKNCNEKGCEICNYKGFLGRTNIAESLKVDKQIKRFLLQEEFLSKIENYLEGNAYKSLKDDGLDKVQQDITTKKELFKVISI